MMLKINLRVMLLSLILVTSFFQLYGAPIKGKVIDKKTLEPLTGVTVQVVGTTVGAITDQNGIYEIPDVKNGNYDLEVRYVSYKTIQRRSITKNNGVLEINFEMEAAEHLLSDITVYARKNLESENMLLKERKASSIAVENIGAQEMSQKGISNVADGVKKITGISFADAGNLIVRGLGDRYSLTTLNGLPIASPNPDNKLIPLDLFPSSTIKNITIKKVYEVGTFADYSGAHIDIGTRENIGEDIFSVSFSVGGNFNTVFRKFYQSDSRYGLWMSNNLSKGIKSMKATDFTEYIKREDPFKSSFNISRKMALPNFGGNIIYGKNIKVGEGKLSVLGSLSVGHKYQTMDDAYKATLTAQGTKLNEFFSKNYGSELNIAALATVGYNFKTSDRINYTMFYARNAMDNYKLRNGTDSEKVSLIGSNSVMHVYGLLNNQLSGKHNLGKRWELLWSGSYGVTSSEEPDRKQVMYREDNGIIRLFKLNQQETMRYFGELNEQEIVGDVRSSYAFGENNALRFGGTFKSKNRDYSSTRFYYNIRNLDPVIDNIDDIFDPSGYLNRKNLENGTVTVLKDAQPKSFYYAGSNIGAFFSDVDYYPVSSLLINVGLRYEHSLQWVRYWNDASLGKISELNKGDLFPALNIKYSLNKISNIKLSASKTITRPGFIEMAPFLYKESFGSDEIRGNEDIKNGYNYNLDLRYEIYPEQNEGDMFSVAGYFKRLVNPIERVQESSGGSAVHSFRNADNGIAAGAEIELRKVLFKNFRVGLNASYIYTNVVLPEDGGIYSESKRALQGASPYLINADVAYSVNMSENQKLRLVLLYNLQGPRIHSVGIYGVGNVIQKSVHTVDFTGHWDINKWSIKLKLTDLLNSTVRYTQYVKTIGKTFEVERYKQGTAIELGVSFRF